MKGLRKQESDKFINFFSIVQENASAMKCTFFLDAGDGREFETDTLEGEDLMGWLIPDHMLGEFEEEWKTGDISDEWSDFYVWAIWKNTENITVEFVEE